MSAVTELDLSSLDKDPRLFLYTSLTAGSSHIVSATSRMETILKANRIPFLAVDLATDEKCRRLWQRRGGAKKKLPGLVKEGYILGDLEEVEEWNEFGELKENIGPVPPSSTAPPGSHVGVSTAPPLSHNVPADKQKVPQTGFDKTKAVALPGAEEMAAIHRAKKASAAAAATSVPASTKPAAATSTSDGKTKSIEKEGAKVADILPEPKKADAEETDKESEKEDTETTATPQEAKQEEPKAADTLQDSKNEDAVSQESKKPAVSAEESKKEDDVPQEVKKEDDVSQESKKEEHTTPESKCVKEDAKKDEDPPTEGVAALQVKGEEAPSKDAEDDVESDDKTTQEQSAKDPEAAGKTVAD